MVSFIINKQNIAHITVNTPFPIKKYPPTAVKRRGVMRPMMMVKIQLRLTAKESPCSVIVSLMYTHGTGPRLSSNITTKPITKKTAKPYAALDSLAYIYAIPSPTRSPAYTKLRVHIRVFLPTLSSSHTVGNVETMLTNPTITVPRFGLNPTLFIIVLE